MFLWKSLEMFVMVTGKVSGIRLPRFLIIAFHLLIVCGTILAFYGLMFPLDSSTESDLILVLTGLMRNISYRM